MFDLFIFIPYESLVYKCSQFILESILLALYFRLDIETKN